MATPALIVVVTVALLTLVALGVTVLVLLQHVRALMGAVRSMRDELSPALEQLSRDTQITQRELQRVSESASELRAGPDGWDPHLH